MDLSKKKDLLNILNHKADASAQPLSDDEISDIVGGAGGLDMDYLRKLVCETKVCNPRKGCSQSSSCYRCDEFLDLGNCHPICVYDAPYILEYFDSLL